MFPSSSPRFLELAVFRFEDVCVAVQEDMGNYLKTAALEVKAGVEATFRWLRRRQVKICLLTDYNREDFLLLAGRLGWGIGPQELIQLVVPEQSQEENPVRQAYAFAKLRFPQQTVVVVDSPRLLQCARKAGSTLVFGVTNGESAYQDLAEEAVRSLLDSPIQLPNYLLSMRADDGLEDSGRFTAERVTPRLWVPGMG